MNCHIAISKFLFFILFIVFSFSGFSQSTNKYNKHGERTGKWITYLDDAKKIKSMQGKYRNGKSVGKNYYYSEGILERKEICRFKKMKTTFYYPSGKIKRKGYARIDNTKTEIHYYFYGTWKSYKENGELEKTSVYQKGKLIRSKYYDKSILINDSLMIAINDIDVEFT
jgi:antitoxin component YwqK of YwqJK toxin-antitoxin module